MSGIVEKSDLEETKEIANENGINAGTNTSPGQLQDVTMDNSYAIGYRSPCLNLQHGSNSSGCGGNTSPGQGRSVREFEEQMAALRKENFNLKLRIYFLEEKIPGYSSSNNQNHQDGHETLLKQNVDLKVDIEVLRKELQEKQKLLCEAAKAMDLMEQQQKATEEQSQAIIDELNEKIRYLESENKELEKLPIGQHTLDQLMGRTELGSDIDTVQKIRELEGFIKQYEQKTDELTDKINELETNLNEKNDNINLLEKKIKELEYQNSELQEQLDIKTQDNINAETKIKELKRKLNQDLNKNENDNNEQRQQQQLAADYEKLKNDYDKEKSCNEEKTLKIQLQQKLMEEMQYQKLKEELIDYKKQLADKICTLEEVETKLQQKTKEHEKACNAIQKLLKNTKDLQFEIEKLRKVDSLYQQVSQIKEERSSDTAVNIRQSFSDLTAGTSEWNAIKTKLEKLIDEKDTEIKNLKAEIKKKTANLQNLVNKELWEKNREIERLTKLLNKAQSHPISVPNSPTKEIDQLQLSFTDFDYNAAVERNKCLQKKVDTLIQRLCSVAEQNPEPLVQQLRIELQEAREEAEKAHHWRKECTDVCEILKDRLEELAGFLDSLLEDDVLGALAADKRRAMRKAINRSLEMSRSLNNMSLSRSRLSVSGIGEQSLIQLSSISGILDLENKENRTFNSNVEDKNQGLVMIENLKAEIKALKKELDRRKTVDSAKKERRSLPVSLPVENQSESEAWSEPDRKVSLARIGLEEPMLIKSSVSNIKEEQHESTTTENGEIDPARKSKWCKAQKKIAMLEQMISERDNRILEVQCELVEADNRLKQENLRLIEINRELEEYKKVNEVLEIEIANFKIQENDYNDLKCKFEATKRELAEKENKLGQVQQERDNLGVEICVTEMKIKTLKTDIEDLKLKYEKQLEAAIEQEQQKVTKFTAELKSEWEEKMKQQEEKFQSNLARDWVSRSLYTDLKQELENVQKRLCEAQSTIEFLHENESELNNQLIENEKSVRNLKKKLDDATLQASKAALERTKAMNDKLQLETKVNELIKKLEKVETDKHELTAKLTQVEKSNSLLHKKLTNYIDMTTGNNMSTNVNITTNNKTRKPSSNGGSEASQSGYTSEDVPMINNRHNNNVEAIVCDTAGGNRSLQRHENSSPDLGIESDVGGGSGIGRTSSVEMVPGQRDGRRLLKPINILSGDDVQNDLDKETPPESSDCDAFVDTVNNNTTALVTTATSATEMVKTIIHDCVKVEKENEELRRKLRRTKIAFEDTCNKLRSANQRKEQIERDLRQQIEKTQKVLKNVRTNLENELEQPKKK